MASVLLLKPFNVCLNFKYLTVFVVQQSGIRISSVLRVISFLNFAVSVETVIRDRNVCWNKLEADVSSNDRTELNI
jgi:hypothetical protein